MLLFAGRPLRRVVADTVTVFVHKIGTPLTGCVPRAASVPGPSAVFLSFSAALAGPVPVIANPVAVFVHEIGSPNDYLCRGIVLRRCLIHAAQGKGNAQYDAQRKYE